MKVNISREEYEAFDRATIRGSIEGVAAGLAISLPASFAAQRYLPAYRALPMSLKALGVVLIVGPAWAVQTERRGVEFDEEHNWKGVSRQLLDNAKAREASEWDGLSSKEKFSNWFARNQYKVIVGSWATSMAIAGTIIMRDRHQSTSQKVVQARMWAQGLTIGILIAAGILTHSQRQDATRRHAVDHSWREFLDAEMEAESRKVRQLGPNSTVA